MVRIFFLALVNLSCRRVTSYYCLKPSTPIESGFMGRKEPCLGISLFYEVLKEKKEYIDRYKRSSKFLLSCCFAIKLSKNCSNGIVFSELAIFKSGITTRAIHTKIYDSKYPMFLSPQLFIYQLYSCFEKIILPALRCLCLDMKESDALWKFRRLLRDLDSGFTVSLHIPELCHMFLPY